MIYLLEAQSVKEPTTSMRRTARAILVLFELQNE